MKVHHLSDAQHYQWDNSLDPALTVESGDVVVFDCPEAADGQFTPETTLDILETLDWGRIHSLTGPVAIDGAQPGDVLEVEILDIQR